VDVVDIAVLIVDLARTVKDDAVSFPATVSTPVDDIDVPGLAPSSVHVTVCGGLFTPVTVAVNVRVLPLATDTPTGKRVMPVILELTTILKALSLMPVVFVFVALAVKLNVPCAVGVPEITPVVAFKVRPPGRFPLVIDHVIGDPVALNVWL